ncbi:MAG: 2-oxo acid dehydrogenase subunit E2 [Alicyclobacillus sp.]|nr:2-oxo acid dehydrogenase subunit E2 [Alicyclobacillus sp.]
MPDVKMPQLGESVTEGTIGRWLKSVGDTVAKYEPIAEVVTDKVTAEIPSDFDGVMEALLVEEGATVQVGTVICRIATEADSAGDEGAAPPRREAQSENPAVGAAAKEEPNGRTGRSGRFSPAVLRLAEEHGVDLARVEGTGEGGRITRKDVLRYVEQAGQQPQSQASEPPVADDRSRRVESGRAPAHDAPPVEADRGAAPAPADDEVWIEPSPIRKTIARRMVESKHNAPHAWTMVEADVSGLVTLRNRVKADFKRREGIDLTFLPFFIKAVVEGLKRYPMLNASWVDDKIVQKRAIHISIAVATDDALVVPVIHHADRLSIAGLAHAVNELAAKARSGRLTVADMQGGTFTVNNTGAFGSILSQPILNAPQAAILSVESIVKRPVVVEGDAIAVRSMVNLCLSLDHRVLDGWLAGSFLKAVRQRLETFGEDTAIY